MEQTLKQRIIPEVDERQTRRESEKVAEFLDESVKEFLPFTDDDGIFDLDEMIEDMEQMQEMTDEMVGNNDMFESFEAGGFAGDVAFGEGPAEMGGSGGDDELTQKLDELVNEMSGPRGQDGVADRLNDVGTKIDENKEEAAMSTALLSRLGTILKGGAATLLIGGFALSLLQGIYGRVKAFAQHSPLLETVVDMIGMAMSLFLRPIARAIGRAMLPMAMAMLNLAADFNRVWSEGGAFAAFGFLAGELKSALFSLPGLVAVAITGVGTLLGAAIGSYAGAKAGAIIGGTIGSIIPGFGTAVGAAIGGTLGLIAGVLIGFNWEEITAFLGRIWRKITDVENILSFFLGPLAIVAIPFFMFMYKIFTKIRDYLASLYETFQEGGLGAVMDKMIADVKGMLGLEGVDLSKFIVSYVKGLFEDITGIDVSEVVDKVESLRDALGDGADYINSKADSVRDALDTASSYVSTKSQDFRDSLDNFRGMIDRKVSGFGSAMVDLSSRISSEASNIESDLSNFGSDIVSGANDIRSDLSSLSSRISSGASDLRTEFNSAQTAISNEFDGFVSSAKKKFGNVVSMLVSEKNDLETALGNIPSKIISMITSLNISPSNFIDSIPWEFPSANQILQQLNVPDIAGTFNRAEGFVSNLGSEIEDTIHWFKDLTSLDVSIPGSDNVNGSSGGNGSNENDDDDWFDDGGWFDNPDYGDAPTTNTADYGGGGDSSTTMGGTSDEQADPNTWIGLASGGIVTDTISTVIGEGNESEVVAPLSKLDSMIQSRSGTNVDISVDGATSDGMSERDLVRAIEQGVQNANGDVNDDEIQSQLKRLVREINKMRSDMDLSVEFKDDSKWEVKR